MSGALGPQGLPSDMMVCFGYSPWLGKHEKCTVRSKKNNTLTNSSVRAVLTRATSLYYPSTISALLIPKYRHPIQIRINEKIETIRDDIDDSRSFEEIAKRKIFEELRDEQNYSVNEIVNKLEIRFGDSQSRLHGGDSLINLGVETCSHKRPIEKALKQLENK